MRSTFIDVWRPVIRWFPFYPSSSNMTFHTSIRAAHNEDASSLAAVKRAARASNGLERIMYPGGLSASQCDERAASHASDIAAPNSVVLVALNPTTERIIGFIHWREVLDAPLRWRVRS